MKYLKFAPYLIIVMLVGTIYIYGAKVDKLQVSLTVCHDANETNTSTIDKMKSNIDDIAASCERTLRSKEETIRKLARIDRLEAKDENNNVQDNSDPILIELNSMFNNNKN